LCVCLLVALTISTPKKKLHSEIDRDEMRRVFNAGVVQRLIALAVDANATSIVADERFAVLLTSDLVLPAAADVHRSLNALARATFEAATRCTHDNAALLALHVAALCRVPINDETAASLRATLQQSTSTATSTTANASASASATTSSTPGKHVASLARRFVARCLLASSVLAPDRVSACAKMVRYAGLSDELLLELFGVLATHRRHREQYRLDAAALLDIAGLAPLAHPATTLKRVDVEQSVLRLVGASLRRLQARAASGSTASTFVQIVRALTKQLEQLATLLNTVDTTTTTTTTTPTTIDDDDDDNDDDNGSHADLLAAAALRAQLTALLAPTLMQQHAMCKTTCACAYAPLLHALSGVERSAGMLRADALGSRVPFLCRATLASLDVVNAAAVVGSSGASQSTLASSAIPSTGSSHRATATLNSVNSTLRASDALDDPWRHVERCVALDIAPAALTPRKRPSYY
jgi:hypothetical protein